MEGVNRSELGCNLPIELVPASKRAFLIEGLDSIDCKKKPYHVDEWDFSATHVVGVGKGLMVSFAATNPEYVRAIQDALYKFYHQSKYESSLPLSPVMIAALRVALQKVADCLGGTNWSELDTQRGWKAFLRMLKKNKYGKEGVSVVVSALNKLTAIGELQSFVDATAVRACASSIKTRQHVALPHRLQQQIVSHALTVIEKYHPYRHEISNVMAEAYDIARRVKSGEIFVPTSKGTEAKPSMTPKAIERRTRNATKKIIHDIPEFEVSLKSKDLSDILTSCLIVVQSFSGVRIGEALSFNKNSVSQIEINGRDITVLRGETTKGNNAVPKVVTWQSHFVAELALELAYDMMASTRSFYLKGVEEKEKRGESSEMIEHMRKQLESAFLVPSVAYQKSSNYIFNSWKGLKKLINILDYKATQADVEEFNMLNPTREGELKVGGTYMGLSSHDFRRSFAVFFVRYGFGTASGIKFQFKHQNINMSGYYANNAVLAQMNDILVDDDVLEDLKEAGIDLGIDIFDEIYNQSHILSGAKGEEIMAERMNKLQAGESMFMTREEIEDNIRRGNFHIIQLPSGAYCTNGSCDRVCGTQPFRAEIKECEHKVVTDKGAKYIAKQRERLIAKFTNLNTGDPIKSSILVALKQKIQVEELTLKKHQIPYAPFDDAILDQSN
ncbi:hypothetical protein [Vibrio parahaemolyticus]|uniref:hypothetical protein n=1 Tax=Vibrio parahaemolyticus TaxID=670 RepID=UPI00041009CA|nr:hypothetical protein [Vibrio parahaemolyticus]EKG2461724.1 hypothetical protein [Vibrio vulnificus]